MRSPRPGSLERVASPRLAMAMVAAVEVPEPGLVRFRLNPPWPEVVTFYGTLATGEDVKLNGRREPTSPRRRRSARGT